MKIEPELPTPPPYWAVLVLGVAVFLLDKVFPLNTGPVSQALAQFVIPLIIGAVGAAASWLKSRAAGKSVQEQEKLYNDWLANRANGVNDLIERLTSNGFNPFGAQVTTQQGSTNSRTNQSSTSTTNSTQQPFVTPDYKNLESLFKNAITSRLAAPTALPPGFIESNVRGINSAYAGATQALKNEAARKGLSGEQVFGAGMPIESARAGKVADFLGNVPLTEQELAKQNIQLGADITKTFGLGQKMSSTTNSSGVSNTSGNSFLTQTAPPNLMGLASLFLPPGPNAPSGTGQSTFGNVGGDLATLMAYFYGNGLFNKPATVPGSGGGF